MDWKEILTGIIIPLLAGFIGGSIGSIVIDKRKMNNKNTTFNNNGDVFNGDKKK
ncbi:MAG: hypothetical protein LBL91_03675 [Lachnospiraceae bacterium]|jgi:hypothetical protein|nr:hypothetical protein [Lachnospiraceae bacterium]